MRLARSILGQMVLWAVVLNAGVKPAIALPCAAEAQIRVLVEDALSTQTPAGATLPKNVNCPLFLTGNETLLLTGLRRDPLLHTLEARLQCRSGECLPFLVRFDVPEERGSIDEGKVQIVSQARPFVRSVRKLSVTQDLVRPGQLVTLLWEKGPLRITRSMVCLDRGIEGQQVRMRSKEGGRIVQGRVVTAELVRAE